MPKRQDLCIAIAVSRPEELKELPGVIRALDEFTDWSSRNGYVNCIVDDRGGDTVSVHALREKIGAFLTHHAHETGIGRILLFFAGHGVVVDLHDAIWLLSEWKSIDSEAISVTAFLRNLKTYGPKQIAVFGDACREISKDALPVNGNGVIKKLQETPSRPQIDRFYAAETGELSYMIAATGAGNKKPFCIFSTALVDVLKGSSDLYAVQRSEIGRVITSGTLYKRLNEDVPSLAADYDVEMFPECAPGFVEPDDVYLQLPEVPVSIALAPPDFTGEEAEAADEAPSLDKILKRVGPFSSFPYPAAPPPDEADSEDFGVTRRKPKTKDAARRSRMKAIPAAAEKAAAAPARPSALEVQQSRRERSAGSISADLQSMVYATRREPAGLIVSGAIIREVIASNRNMEISGTEPNTRDFGNTGREPFQMAVQTEDTVIFAPGLDGYTTRVVVRDHQTAAIEISKSKYGDAESHEAADILARFSENLLSEKDVGPATRMLRWGKHAEFSQGIVAAHILAAQLDTDNIRRIAHYYVKESQPVPFDVALLGDCEIRLDPERGCLRADVPAVAASNGIGPDFEHSSFDRRDGCQILGLMPVVTAAWSMLDDALSQDSVTASWLETLHRASAGLTPSRFTTFRTEPGLALATTMRSMLSD